MNSGYAEVSQPKVAFAIKNEVFWFKISMDDIVIVHILQTQNDAADEELNNMLRKSFMLPNLET